MAGGDQPLWLEYLVGGCIVGIRAHSFERGEVPSNGSTSML